MEQLDCELIRAVSEAVPIPVIASGGAGTFEHFAEVFDSGRADATLAASVFYFADIDALGVDSVVGITIYTGRLAVPAPPPHG